MGAAENLVRVQVHPNGRRAGRRRISDAQRDDSEVFLVAISKRQGEIMELITLGLGDKEIAVRLGVSPHTVRSHMSRLLLTTGLHSRTALAIAWVQSAALA